MSLTCYLPAIIVEKLNLIGLTTNIARLHTKLICDFSGLEETHKLVAALGGRCHSYVVDLANRNEVYVVAKEVRKDCGPVSANY